MNEVNDHVNLSGGGICQGQKMAERTGLEPATSCVTGRRSNQLNYRSVKKLIMSTLAGFYLFGKFLPNRGMILWWAGQGSNLRPPPCKGDALPLSYPPR